MQIEAGKPRPKGCQNGLWTRNRRLPPVRCRWKDTAEFIKNIADEISFNARMKFGMELAKGQMNFQEDLALKYGENSFITMNFGYLDGDGYIGMPELYNKSFYIKKRYQKLR